MAPGAWHEGAVTGVCRSAPIAVHGRCPHRRLSRGRRASWREARPSIGRGAAQGAVGRRREDGRGLGRPRASGAQGAILGAILVDLAGDGAGGRLRRNRGEAWSALPDLLLCALPIPAVLKNSLMLPNHTAEVTALPTGAKPPSESQSAGLGLDDGAPFEEWVRVGEGIAAWRSRGIPPTGSPSATHAIPARARAARQ